MQKNISYFSLFAIIAAAVLWLFAPFLSLSLLSFGNQLTGFEILTKEFFLIGRLTGTTLHLASCGAFIGIIGAFVGILMKSNIATKGFCITGGLLMAPVFFDIIISLSTSLSTDSFFDSAYIEMYFSFFGFGYSGIYCIFIVLLFVRNYTLSYVQSTNSSESGATYTYPSVSSSISPEAERNIEEKIRNNLKKSLLDEIEDALRDKIIAEMQQDKNVRNEHSDILTDTQNNIFCGHCGKKIPSDSAFCGHCGNPLS